MSSSNLEVVKLYNITNAGKTSAVAEAGAVPLTAPICSISADSVGMALTLADGYVGQELILQCIVAAGSDTAVVTPATLFGADTTITFDAVNEYAMLKFLSAGWVIVKTTATVA